MLRATVGTTGITVLLCVAGASIAGAQIALGRHFRVDTSLESGWSYSNNTSTRSISMTPDGRFVIVWGPGSPTSSLPLDVAVQRFSASGRPIGRQSLVNTYTTGAQEWQTVAMDAGGNFIVAWEHRPGSEVDVMGQRFDAAGNAVGSNFVANQQVGLAVRPAIAVAATGESVVAWAGNTPSYTGVWARRYDASGAALGSDFQVTTRPNYPQSGGPAPSVSFDAGAAFVVVWDNTDTSFYPPRSEVVGRLYSADGTAQGPEFVIASAPPGVRVHEATVARAPDGSFVVAWADDQRGIYARRFDAGGAPVGVEFIVSAIVAVHCNGIDLAVDNDGDVVFVWEYWGIYGRRFEAAGGSGPEFAISRPTVANRLPSVAGDPAGNFAVTWHASAGVPYYQVHARRYAGGLMASSLSFDDSVSDTNGVFEPGENGAIVPSWLNANFGAQTFTGTASSFAGPGAPGNPTYTILDGAADYGMVASGATASCAAAADCYRLRIGNPSVRPAAHWDATLRENIAPANLGAFKNWTLHVGDSFSDVPRTSPFYRFVETILHHGVTSGCGTATYCPSAPATRDQMAVFVLVAKEGSGYAPPACGTALFADVPANSPFCPWIEELARRGVVTGCGGGNFCPDASVSREQMAVFVLATESGANPPACGAPMFNDVRASSPFCPWVEELARRGVVAGCGSGAYCPTSPVTREQMSAFLAGAFGLALYGA